MEEHKAIILKGDAPRGLTLFLLCRIEAFNIAIFRLI